MDRFKYLIKKQVFDVYHRYRLKQIYNYESEDWMNDALVEFIDLVVNDFKIKSGPTDSGFAVFGNYIKVKFFRRLQWRAQTLMRKRGLGKDTLADVEGALLFDGHPEERTVTDWEITESIVANALNFEDEMLEDIHQTHLQRIADSIVEISYDLVKAGRIEMRDRDIWQEYYTGGLMVDEIGLKYTSVVSPTEKIGRHRVLQIARRVNETIIAEFGRRNAVKFSGIRR